MASLPFIICNIITVIIVHCLVGGFFALFFLLLLRKYSFQVARKKCLRFDSLRPFRFDVSPLYAVFFFFCTCINENYKMLVSSLKVSRGFGAWQSKGEQAALTDLLLLLAQRVAAIKKKRKETHNTLCITTAANKKHRQNLTHFLFVCD